MRSKPTTWRRPAALLAALAAAATVSVTAGGAAAPHAYAPHTPAYDLWAIEATLTAQRDALAPGAARTRLDRALKSLHWALADVRWTAAGFLTYGPHDNGIAGLRDLRTTIGRLTWVDAKEAYEQDVVAIASVIGAVARHRFDEVSRFVGEGSWAVAAPDVLTEWRGRILASQRDLRVGDASADRVHAASTYTRVWLRLNGLPPCCTEPYHLLEGEWSGTSADRISAGRAEAFQAKAYAGTVTKIRIYVGPDSAASALVAGVYANDGGRPGALLGQGRLEAPEADAWNVVPLAAGVPVVTASSSYWIAFLSPDGSGALGFRDGCCGIGSPTELSAETSLSELPAVWATGRAGRDGPPVAYGLG